MKPRHLTIFFFAGALLGVGMAAMLASARSSGEHAVFLGLSGPRAAMAVVLLAAAAGSSTLGLTSVLRPVWADRAADSLDRHLCHPDRLLAATFFTALAALAIPAAALAGSLAGYGQVVRRLGELLAWAGSMAVLGLALLSSAYSGVYRQPGFLAGAPGRIARVSFLGRPGFWLGVALAALAAVVLVPSSSISMRRVPSHDSGIFLYFGQQILRGQIPFRDLWDHKPPGIFYADALGLLLGNGSPGGVWALEYLSLAASALTGFWILRRAFGRIAAALSVAFCLGFLVFLLEGGNLTEEFALPLQFTALALFTISARRGWAGRGAALRACAVGVLFALALNVKQSMVGIWAALFLWLAYRWLIQRDRGLGRVFVWAGAGAAAAQGAILLYYAAHHALTEYWQVAWVYNLIYSDVDPGTRVNALADLADFLTHTSLLFPLVIAAWLAGLVLAVRAAARREAAPGFPFVIALIDLPIELVLVSTSGKNYRHYFMSLVPAMTILAAWGVDQLARLVRRWGIRLRYGLPAALIAAVVILWPSARDLSQLARPASELTITQTVQLILRETRPQDTVLMWGSQTVVNYLSGRAAPTRFVHQKPLFRAGFASPALSAEMLRDLQNRRPALIINTHLPSTPFVTVGADGACLLPKRLPEGMEAVFRYICGHYRLEQVITKDRWEVYRLISP